MKRTSKTGRAVARHPKKPSKLPMVILLSAGFTLFAGFMLVAGLLALLGIAACRYYNAVVPDGVQTVAAFESQPVAVSLIEDRKGYTLQELVNPSLGTRVLIPLTKIPHSLIWATIDTENATFYRDIGIDPIRIFSAAKTDVFGRTGLQGASTITQQLVKLAIFPSNVGIAPKLDKTNLQKKLREIVTAIGLTRDIKRCSLRCRKDAILEMYFNTVPYGVAGGDINGVEAASEYFFGIPASQLDLARSALIAGLPQAPSEYNPLVFPDRAKARQIYVLHRMLAQRHITEAQFSAAEAEPLHYHFKPIVAHNAEKTNESYFVHWLLKDYLSQAANLKRFGIPDLQRPNDIYRDFIFQTTLDPDWQNAAQDIINRQVASNSAVNMTDGALVAIDPRSNEIKAYVGGVGYGSGISGAQYDMAWQMRQAGSSFKPFMYVTAFENGHFPAETIDDSYVSFPNFGSQGPYTPLNYDLHYHGLVTLRQALANSYNVPAVKTLYSIGLDGIKKVIHTTNSVGYHLQVQNPRDLGLSLALGADPGRLIDEVNGYAVFANNGVYRPYMPLTAIYRRQPDGTRKLLWKYKPPKGEQVIAPQFSYLITNILSDTAAKVPAFGQAAYDYLGLPDRPVASKTGTTSDFKDNLTLGYTPDLVAGVWVGNPNNTPMLGSTGITGAAPAWHEFMVNALHGTAPQQFIQPTGIITAMVARYAPAGSRPGLAASGNGVTDIFAAGTVPTTFDNPSHDVYSGHVQIAPSSTHSAPGTTVTTTTDPAASNPCNSSAYSYTTVTRNGQVYYDVMCQ
ncbi:MAG: penicillin-binding protein [Chloroflexi bacterium]|nr:penicillin-binding protein [Chloroflexota bacterium]